MWGGKKLLKSVFGYFKTKKKFQRLLRENFFLRLPLVKKFLKVWNYDPPPSFRIFRKSGTFRLTSSPNSPSPSAPTTLFPPTSSPTTTENPLRRFFPLEDDRDTGNGVAALFSGKQNGRSAGINSNCSNSFILLTSVFMLIFLSFEWNMSSSWLTVCRSHSKLSPDSGLVQWCVWLVR